MPPCLDVYVLTGRRTRGTINEFLAEYVDVPATGARGIGVLTVLPLHHTGAPDDLPLSEWESVVVSSVEQAVEFGVSTPARAFTMYLKGKRAAGCGALLCFTRAGELIVGASVDDSLHETRSQESAIRLMDDLVTLVGGRHGWVVGETPPPLDPDVERPWEDAYVIATTSE